MERNYWSLVAGIQEEAGILKDSPVKAENCPKGQWYPARGTLPHLCLVVPGDRLSKNTEGGTPAGRMGGQQEGPEALCSDLSAVEGTGGTNC